MVKIPVVRVLPSRKGIEAAGCFLCPITDCNKMVGFGRRVLANGKEKELESLQSVSRLGF